MIDLAREIAATVLGRDPGPLFTASGLSHNVFVGPDIVVKVIDATGHVRLNREIALAPHLPAGITAPLLGSGLHRRRGRDVRYACYTRMPGSTPGMGLPGMDKLTACRLAEEAVHRLDVLHRWTPTGSAEQTLREPLDHGGFVGKSAMLAEIQALCVADAIPPHLLDGLTAIAERAPERALTDVPVHADCHWGNWLVSEGRLTALLDFEWARFGEPMDDWFYVIADSGPHMAAVLDVVARLTSIPAEVLRAEGEVREAMYLASDINLTVRDPELHRGMAVERRRRLEELIIERVWWR